MISVFVRIRIRVLRRPLSHHFYRPPSFPYRSRQLCRGSYGCARRCKGSTCFGLKPSTCGLQTSSSMDASSKPFCLFLKSLLYSWVAWYRSSHYVSPFSHLSSSMICPPHIAPHAHITSRTVLSCITIGYSYLSPCVDIYYLALFSFSLCLLSCFFHILYNCCSLSTRTNTKLLTTDLLLCRTCTHPTLVDPRSLHAA